MRKTIIALALCLAPFAPALADDHDWPRDTDLTIEQAIEIAYGQGIAVIREIEFDDGCWEIEGRNADGARIELDLDGETGEIVRCD